MSPSHLDSFHIIEPNTDGNPWGNYRCMRINQGHKPGLVDPDDVAEKILTIGDAIKYIEDNKK